MNLDDLFYLQNRTIELYNITKNKKNNSYRAPMTKRTRNKELEFHEKSKKIVQTKNEKLLVKNYFSSLEIDGTKLVA